MEVMLLLALVCLLIRTLKLRMEFGCLIFRRAHNVAKGTADFGGDFQFCTVQGLSAVLLSVFSLLSACLVGSMVGGRLAGWIRQKTTAWISTKFLGTMRNEPRKNPCSRSCTSALPVDWLVSWIGGWSALWLNYAKTTAWISTKLGAMKCNRPS